MRAALTTGAVLLLMSGCSASVPPPTPTLVPTASATPSPIPTATPAGCTDAGCVSDQTAPPLPPGTTAPPTPAADIPTPTAVPPSNADQWLTLAEADAGVLDADFELMASDVSEGDGPTLLADTEEALHDIGLMQLDTTPPAPPKYARADIELSNALQVLTDACNKIADDESSGLTELATGENRLAQALAEASG